MTQPSRGEVWYVDLDPVRGHEQAGHRPALIVSVDQLNRGSSELVIVAPITSKAKGVSSHVPIAAPEAGLTMASFVKCEDVRSVSKLRLGRRLGTVEKVTLAKVEYVLRILLGL
jgi:mRNA interferase MazF